MKFDLNQNLKINQNRFLRSIDQLAHIGALPDGGIRRIAYSEEDINAREQVKQWMEEAGMSIRVDTAGNVIGRYAGKIADAPALATGSHIDTVPRGGRYDGSYGVLAGIEMVQVLHDNQIRLNHALEVIVFTDEEGSMIGSKAISGSVVADPATYRQDDGTDIYTCLERIGGSWEKIDQARRTAQDLAAFVELHVEQGPVLEKAGVSVGVVKGIVGQRRFKIAVQGEANHAGTTPMNCRRDALLAAAKLTVAINKIANSGGEQVATVGHIQAYPNTVNAVPGLVEMSLDIRDLSSNHLDQLLAQVRDRAAEIAAETDTEIGMQPALNVIPATAQSHIQSAISQACDELSLNYTHLLSRASHDAQEMAKVTDMGMIFVPSEAGLSHNAEEYTSPEDCVHGANVLLRTMMELDRHYGSSGKAVSQQKEQVQSFLSDKMKSVKEC
ncbi:MAG: Zn-dependent hydrolase [Halothece sp. Uz-M2-17]|nr:Zn-dependent hydrolase [Halothece sp. Uz-M2-17]